MVVRPVLAGRARFFHGRWQQTLHTQEDLLRMMELALWRAVDKWDPKLTPNIVRYVDVQVARAAEKALRQAAGYPDERRSAPAVQVYIEDCMVGLGAQRSFFAHSRLNESKGRKTARPGVLQERAGQRQNGSMFMEKLLSDAVPDGFNQEQLVIRNQEGSRRLQALLKRYTEGFHRRLLLMVLVEGYTVDGAADAMFSSPRLRRVYQLQSREQARKVAHAVVVRVRLAVERGKVSEAHV